MDDQELIDELAELFKDIPDIQKLPLVRMISSLDVAGIDMWSALETSKAIWIMLAEYSKYFEGPEFSAITIGALEPVYAFTVTIAEHLRKK
jgi:hypothetical protein